MAEDNTDENNAGQLEADDAPLEAAPKNELKELSGDEQDEDATESADKPQDENKDSTTSDESPADADDSDTADFDENTDFSEEKPAETGAKPKKKEVNPFREILKEKDTTKIEVTPEQQKARGRMVEIRDKLMTLRWDYEHGQINPAKRDLYLKLKKEYEDLEHVAKGN